MRVLVVPDKFKGTLTAQQAAEAIARGWGEARPDDQLELVPMSDGGDGFGEIVGKLLNGRRRTSNVVNAAHDPIQAEWWWSEEKQTAVVESAKVIGLAMLPPGEFHPFDLDTYGLGNLLEQIALEHPNANLLIGIGGSATNDAGFGMARGLGYQFLDASGQSIESWVNLDGLARIEPPVHRARFGNLTIACDVQNPLLGPAGASRVYGPQKGLLPDDFPIADRSFERLVETVKRNLALSSEEEPGTGAAGGLGYGLRVFLGGYFRPGFEIFSEAAHLSERILRADLVVTGEGSIDRQTMMGKGTGAIAQVARREGKRCIGLAGSVQGPLEGGLFATTLGIAPALTSVAEAKSQPSLWLSRLAAEAGRTFEIGTRGS